MTAIAGQAKGNVHGLEIRYERLRLVTMALWQL